MLSYVIIFDNTMTDKRGRVKRTIFVRAGWGRRETGRAAGAADITKIALHLQRHKLPLPLTVLSTILMTCRRFFDANGERIHFFTVIKYCNTI